MKTEKFPAKQVLVIGPTVDVFKLKKALFERNIPCVFTSDIIDALLPSYKEMDVKRKAHSWRPLIDHSVDLLLSHYCLLRVPKRSLIVTDRLSATFISQTVIMYEMKPIFVGVVNPTSLLERMRQSITVDGDDRLAARWARISSEIANSHCSRIVEPSLDQKDAADLVGVAPNSRGDLQWVVFQVNKSQHHV